MALRLTAVTLLLRPMGSWLVLPAILGLAVLALVSPRVLRAPATWIALAALVALRIAGDWPLADNHVYLLAYWCLAAGLGLRAGAHAADVLAISSRWLVGLAFALAVAWKAVLSPDYLDGRFFRVTLLTDPRFEEAATVVGGLTPAELEANRVALEAMPEGAALLDPPAIVEPWRLRAFAWIGTWGVLALEAAVAIAFLVPAVGVVRRARPVLLLAFCATTYAFAPVAGFGWLLICLGLAQCADGETIVRRAYVAAYLLVGVYAEVPWIALFDAVQSTTTR